jgi:2-polyprenyl-3-methyl-5-hydroxy-6-metoxy-1,4-benzoquinol methylase
MCNKCYLCDSSKNKIVFNEFGIDMLKCKKCGHVYSSYKQDQNYADYFGEKIEKQDHFWWKEAHDRMYNDFGEKFLKNKKGRILDVGCGLGYFLKFISKYNNWKGFGSEISKSAVEYADKNLGLENIKQGRVEESGFSNNYFDIISLWDVIEHIPNPRPLLSYLYDILKENGVLFMHTPNISIQLPKAKFKKIIKGLNKDVHYMEAKDHINIYSQKIIKRLLKEVGFKKIKFIHLRPLQGVSGSKNIILKNIKNIWFYFSVFLFYMTFGKINIDNLFIVASK